MARLLSGAWREANCSPPDLSAHELEEILTLLLQSNTAPLAWWRIRNSSLAHTVAGERLHTAYRVQSLREAEHQMRVASLVEKFHAQGIEPILMKGWSMAQFYPQAALRPYSDVDLMVPPAQRKAAEALSAVSQGVAVDLQHDEITRFDNHSWDDLYARSQLKWLGETRIRVLSSEDQLRALCIHFLKHGGWGPLWLCDIAVLVESRPPTFRWDVCLGGERRQRSWVTCALLLAHSLIGMEWDGVPLARAPEPLPRWVEATVLEQWGSSPRAHRAAFRTYFRHPARIGEAIADRWPPNPIVATLTSGACFGACPRLLLQTVEVLSRLGKCFFSRSGATVRAEVA
ncbi:MAG TPA: nucleotidyltransferase family protein [Terriglobales bacterium]|nr:nucleotidyltransferase family protein [Terriglobales bacterium]